MYLTSAAGQLYAKAGAENISEATAHLMLQGRQVPSQLPDLWGRLCGVQIKGDGVF